MLILARPVNKKSNVAVKSRTLCHILSQVIILRARPLFLTDEAHFMPHHLGGGQINVPLSVRMSVRPLPSLYRA